MANSASALNLELLRPGTILSMRDIFDYWIHQRLAVVHGSVSMRIGDVTNLLGSGRDGSIYATDRRLCVHRGVVDAAALCRMFNRAIRTQTLPKYLSSDHDPLYRFQPWQANLRVLEIQEIKTVPYVPLSHPFVERLIGTIRREVLDQTLFWTAADLEDKLQAFQGYFNKHRAHSGLEGRLPEPGEEKVTLNFASYRWKQHCRGLYQTPTAA